MFTVEAGEPLFQARARSAAETPASDAGRRILWTRFPPVCAGSHCLGLDGEEAAACCCCCCCFLLPACLPEQPTAAAARSGTETCCLPVRSETGQLRGRRGPEH